MDSPVRAELYRDLENWGYPLFRSDTRADPLELLKELVQCDDIRLLEGFPVVLTSWLTDRAVPSATIEELEQRLDSSGEKKRFRLLVAATWQLMLTQKDLEEPRETLKEFLQSRDPNLIKEIRTIFAEDRKLNLGRSKLSPERLQTTYNNYVVSKKLQQRERVAEQIVRAREIAFNESLSELFAERQVDIIRKILARQSMTKTEREYFSRVIKKRLAALANPDLHTLATSMLGRQDAFIRSELKVEEEKSH